MKKTIFSSVLMLVILASASAAMATTLISGQVSLSASGNSFTPSSKVGISLTSLTNSYAATSCHVSGTYEYGTLGGTGLTGAASDPSKIYQTTIPTQSATATVGAPDATTSATSLPGSGWQ